ncbi:helix-turn-helix domain-containing protein [Campylobacter anatolicus]
MSLKNIEKICLALDCNIGEVINFEK